ncbi:hypothetical protein GQ600_17375 [Phytophthora cactorum]|nr:hypothetical protein GQ600_17375 [Phytophthora cactorum]
MFTPAQAAGFFFQPCRDEHDEVILEEHPDYESLMLAATTAETGSILNYVRRSSLNLFSWLEWILKNNLPLSLCENDADDDSICVETLVAGMVNLTRAVERIIAGEMPERFGLILDNDPLLCMAPVLNEEEESLSACGHMEFLATMLPQDYGKQLDQCCFLSLTTVQ